MPTSNWYLGYDDEMKEIEVNETPDGRIQRMKIPRKQNPDGREEEGREDASG
jgi:hypothetical protein